MGRPDKEPFRCGEQEPWVYRGGLHAEFRVSFLIYISITISLSLSIYIYISINVCMYTIIANIGKVWTRIAHTCI